MQTRNLFLSLLVFGVVALVAVVWPAAPAAAATVYHVHPGDSIQQAVDLAGPGDQILVHAGLYVENVTIPTGKAGLTVAGTGEGSVILQSAGNLKQAPAGVPADIVFDIFSPGVTVRNLTIRHPEAVPTARDIGVFVRPPAQNVTLSNLVVERLRSGDVLEPTAPGSRGLLVFQATGTTVRNSLFQGNYEDHIHLPASATTVLNNQVHGATRLGIVIIQETAESLSVANVLTGNTVSGSGSDGIQVQGDDNLVQANRIWNNGGYGIHLCGTESAPACVVPGTGATASGNVVRANQLDGNALGALGDFGEANEFQGPGEQLSSQHRTVDGSHRAGCRLQQMLASYTTTLNDSHN
jgi:hypothetical protein